MGLFFNFKFLFFIIVLLTFCLFLNSTKTRAQVDSDTITLVTNVQPMIALVVSDGLYNFGDLTAGTPKKGSDGIIAGVTTNAENGYDLSANDNVPGNDSCMLHTDGVTRIIDFSSSIAAPSLWNYGVSKGLGITVFSADTAKEAKWGTGTTFNSDFNKYAGIPQLAMPIHTSTHYKTVEDQTGIAFVIDVETGQKTGIYSGNMILSATANLL